MPDRPPRYRLSPRAEADLEKIWLHTLETWSIEQANRYHKDIVTTFEALASGRKKGRPVALRQGYLRQSAGMHFVFYRHSDVGIEIIRILERRRSPARAPPRPPPRSCR